MNPISKKLSTLMIHILVWVLFIVVVSIQFYFKFETIPQNFYTRTLIFIFVFYLNYSILVPNLLLNNKIWMYIIVVLSFFLCVSLVIEPLISPIANGMGKIAEMHPRPPMHSNFREPMGFKRHSFPIFLSLSLFFALSTSIRLAAEWYKKEKERNLIEAQKVNSELSFLKAQLNPHFLFNTLNSIYSLANKKSESVTEAIVTLSELMRYMIYEANENIVPLKKEIEHIQNYISLQLLRIKDSSGVKVNIHGDLNYKIEPLLLISFIENAFKYGTDFKGKTTIIIKITIQNNELHLYIYNKSSLQDTKKENSGIGLQNIYNRLNLLYPNAHKLDILDGDKSYEVNLRIQLKNNNS